jgi:hypothetical protein
MGDKRVIRQRVWASDDDKAGSRQVGENLRQVESAVKAIPQLRIVELSNINYSSTSGVDVANPTRPQGVIAIHVEQADGTQPTAVSGTVVWTYSAGSTLNMKIVGLSNGQRYATIRLLVIG